MTSLIGLNAEQARFVHAVDRFQCERGRGCTVDEVGALCLNTRRETLAIFKTLQTLGRVELKDGFIIAKEKKDEKLSKIRCP